MPIDAILRLALLPLLTMPRFLVPLLFTLVLSPAAQANDLGNAAQTVAGIYGSIWLHELGHAATAKAFGATDIRIEVPPKGRILSGVTYFTYPRQPTPAERRAVALSGMIAANLGAELVLQNRGLHRNEFAQSILGTSLASNAIHVYTYYTKWVGVDGYRGNDIDDYARAGGNPHLMSAALVGYTAWSLRRMRKKEIPLFYVNLKF